MKKKLLAALLSVSMIAAMLAGCGGQEGTKPEQTGSAEAAQTEETAEAQTGQTEETAEGDFSGVTLVFAQDLTNKDEKANTLTDEIIKEWEAKTGATVLFEKQPTDYRVWLTTQFTANQGPDVYTGILYDITSDYETGYLYNFKELYEQENPYDPGQPWKETLPESILERMYLTNGDIPGYPSSTSVVRIFYNKTLFDQVGAEVPETWEDFMDVCRKLKDGGITPFGFPNASKEDLSWLWFNNSVCGQLNNELVAKADVSGNGFIELNEMVKAFDEKALDFTTAPLKESFELMKEFSQYWTSDYNGLDQQTAIDMFIRGDVAMVQAMSTNLSSVSVNVGDSFEYGVMPIPVITNETSEYAMNKSVILGGQPDIIFAINKACESDPKKLAAAIDFARYMSSSEVQKRFAEGIYRIPLSTKTELPDSLSGFIITEEPLRMPYYTGVNNELRDFFCRGGQMYLEGSYDTEAFAGYVQESFATVFETIKAENDWSADNNYGLN